MTYADRLKRVIRTLNMNYVDFAKLAFSTQPTISKWTQADDRNFKHKESVDAWESFLFAVYNDPEKRKEQIRSEKMWRRVMAAMLVLVLIAATHLGINLYSGLTDDLKTMPEFEYKRKRELALERFIEFKMGNEDVTFSCNELTLLSTVFLQPLNDLVVKHDLKTDFGLPCLNFIPVTPKFGWHNE
ncbi:hypothetical protein [Terasakiella pusilla]|uniref:hypothetical protein n=1 Tax=Terasakiella pusilla TaxID=64973 RepID=UPI003AA9B23D